MGIACQYLGRDNPELFKDALKAFDRAILLIPGNIDAKIAVGELFLEKYNSADAQAAFEEVLAANPKDTRALIGEAKRRFVRFPDRRSTRCSRVRSRSNRISSRRATSARKRLLEIEEYALA